MQKLKFSFDHSKSEGLKILCLGAHCDDIEIGCGGTILKLIQQYDIEEIHWVVFCSNTTRKKEAEESASQFLEGVKSKVTVHNFKDGYTPAQWSEIKDKFEKLKKIISPDVIFTHTRDDRHQDHRTIHNFTWNTFRNHMILEYEIPKYDGDLTTPALYVEVDRETAERKNRIILESFQSQQNKHWLDDELLNSLMRIRGVESVSESGFAEGFHVRKMVFK